jgi:outer membrane autotransporter protein
VPEARAFWGHEYAADTRNIRNQFESGGPEFLVYGQNLGRDWGEFGLGLSMQLGDRVRLGLHYDAYVTPDAVAHGGMGQVQLAW